MTALTDAALIAEAQAMFPHGQIVQKLVGRLALANLRADKAEAERDEWKEACIGHGDKASAAEKRADKAEADAARLREALEQIAVYGCGMLSQPAAMNGPEENWLKKRIREYERVARAALSPPTPEPVPVPVPVQHKATCESNGHIYGRTAKCVFCEAPKPEVQ